MFPEITPAQHYSALMDSVNLIKELETNPPINLSNERRDELININKEHLKIMVVKDFWTDEDLSEAISLIN